MKSRIPFFFLGALTALVFLGLLGLTVIPIVSAQSRDLPIDGAGTAGRIARFIDQDTIRNSDIRERINGNIGVGMQPKGPLKLVVNGRLGASANTTGEFGALVVNQGGSGPIATFRFSRDDVKMVITSDGDVGIGTPTPQARLDIADGALAVGGNPGVSGQVLTSEGAGASPVWNNVVGAVCDYGSSTSSYVLKDLRNVKICYGTLTCNSSGTSVTNLPFSDATSYRVTTAYNGNSENYTVGITQNSGSRFTAYKSQGSETIHWIAIGT